MEILQLEYFRTLAKYEHMTKAAEALYITQPSLSNSLHRLELELGVPLFDRVGRKVQLNAYGKIFLEGVESAFSAIEDSKAKMKSILREEQEKVRIQATSSIQVYPDLITKLISLCPNISFINRDSAPKDVAKSLKEHSTDLCILGTIDEETIDDNAIESEELNRLNFFIVVSKKHHLADRTSITLKDLEHEPFACGRSQMNALNIVCGKAGFKPRIHYEGSNLHDVLLATRSGHYAFLSTWEACLASGIDTNDLVPLKIIDDNTVLTRRLYWRSNDNAVAVLVLRKAITDFFDEWRKMNMKEESLL